MSKGGSGSGTGQQSAAGGGSQNDSANTSGMRFSSQDSRRSGASGLSTGLDGFPNSNNNSQDEIAKRNTNQQMISRGLNNEATTAV